MSFYPNNFRFYFLSKTIRNIELKLKIYSKVCSQIKYFERHRFRLEQKSGMQNYAQDLMSKKEFLYNNFISKDAIFRIYNKNSAVPAFLLFKHLHIYHGFRYLYFKFIKSNVINEKLGKFVKTKRGGTLIHKNNKIYKKMKKKMKQMLAKAMKRKNKKKMIKSKKKSVKKKK